MSRRKPDDDDGGAMDSLLDTMTNVVGILVIVLVVTQLGVGEAVNRIGESIEVDPDQLEDKQAQIDEIDSKTVLLNAQLELLSPSDNRNEDILANQNIELQNKLKQNELLLKNLRQKNVVDRDKLLLGKKEAETQKKEREKLEAEVAASLDEIAKLKATLDTTPERKTLPANVMRLPDPRPAPPGLSPLSLLCDRGMLFPLQLSEIQLAARARAKQIVATKRVMTDGTIDPDKFIKEFSRKPFRNEFFDVEMKASGWRPMLVLNPRLRAGTPERQVVRKNSKFYQDVKNLDRSKTYLKFFVCGDSYDIYLTARKAADENKVFAGWVPVPTGWKFTAPMGGDLYFGTKPPPNPNAQPKPPPKKPNDVID